MRGCGDSLIDPEALDAAMLQSTLHELGEEAVKEMLAAQTSEGEDSGSQSEAALRPPLAWTVHLTFVLMIGAGGLFANLPAGQWQLRMDLGETFSRLMGSGWHTFVLLLLGGGPARSLAPGFRLRLFPNGVRRQLAHDDVRLAPAPLDAPSALELGVEAHLGRAPEEGEQRNARARSEARRVGKECRSRWSPYH